MQLCLAVPVPAPALSLTRKMSTSTSLQDLSSHLETCLMTLRHHHHLGQCWDVSRLPHVPARGGVNSLWIICSGDISRLETSSRAVWDRSNPSGRSQLQIRMKWVCPLMERQVKRGKVEAINLVNAILDFTTTMQIAQQCIIDFVVHIWNWNYSVHTVEQSTKLYNDCSK